MEKVSSKIPFSGAIYNATSYVQNHTLLNRGITTIGGSTIPQCIMSNNKYEAQERATMGIVYLIASYLTPIALIPIYNKHFLKNKGITKTLNETGKNIILVSKRYLTPKANLKDGLEKTAEEIDPKNVRKTKEAFDEIYKRYDDEEKLKKDLLSVHKKVLLTDFITTAAMWAAIPWIATETTEKITKRKDFSAGFNLKSDSVQDENEYKKNKVKKFIGNLFFVTVPAIIYSAVVTKGLNTDVSKLKNKTKIDKLKNSILKKINENPEKFDYTSGTNMSKTIYASIWLLGSFPAKIISSRDANERKDRALRDIGLFTMFFGGDFLINNILGRTADKMFKTKIMNDKGEKLNFFQRFKLPIKNFKTLEKSKDIPKEVLEKTKTVGAGIYWASLLTNTALIGFLLPKFLNKFLRKNIDKETCNYTYQSKSKS